MSTKFEWDEVKETNYSSSPKEKKESDYARLEPGQNLFRVISDEKHIQLMYWIAGRYQQSADAPNSSTSVCPIAKLKDEEGRFYRPRPYYIFKAIDRRLNKVKVLRVSKQVALQMKAYHTSENWGPLTNYDICIQKGPQSSSNMYMVMPMPRPLSDDDKKLIAESTIDLSKKATPPQVKYVQQFIDQHMKKTTSAAPAAAATAEKAKPQKAPEPEVSNDFSSDTQLDVDFEDLE